MPSGCRVMDSIVSGQVGRGTVPLSHKIAILVHSKIIDRSNTSFALFHQKTPWASIMKAHGVRYRDSIVLNQEGQSTVPVSSDP